MTKHIYPIAISSVMSLFVPFMVAHAQPSDLPVDVNVLKMVNLPRETPRLTVLSRDVVDNLRVVVRDGHKTVASKSFGKLGKGGNRTMTWRAEPGIHEYTIEVSGRSVEGKTTISVEAVVTVMRPLDVVVFREQADVEERSIPIKINNPAGHVEFTAYGENNRKLYEGNQDFTGKPGSASLIVTWPKLSEAIKLIKLRVFDISDSWVAVELLPFLVEIPHVDVVFETNKWEIRESESSKLDEAYERLLKAIREHGDKIKARVYIIGHTDTVGKDQDNLVLSRHRADAIAGYFKAKRGITLPILACGVGEALLAVKTGDSVDEARNRRAQYILAAQAPIPCTWAVVSGR
jgi:hypothetical protein